MTDSTGQLQFFPALPPAIEAALRASIQRFGVLVPVVQDQHGRVLDGHHRSRIADEVGVRYRVDVVQVRDEDEAREIQHTLNADRRQLTEEQRREVALALRQEGHSFRAIAGALGVSHQTVANDLEIVNPLTISEPERVFRTGGGTYPARRPNLVAAMDSAEAARAQQVLLCPGDMLPLPDGAITEAELLRLAKHQQGEARKREQAAAQAAVSPAQAHVWRASWEHWLPEQPPCDLLLTDPPYMTDVEESIAAFAQRWLPVALGKVKRTGRAYVCVGAYPQELAAYLAVDPGDLTLAQVLVWTYRNTLGPTPAYDYKSNWQAILYYRGAEAPPLNCPEMIEQFSVQDLNAPDGRVHDRWHAWQKPEELAERLVRHSTAAGELVLDCFAGTGTFLLAAARLGRTAAGCDVDPEMLGIARDRGCQVYDA